MTRPLRHNVPQAHLNQPETIQSYAADKLRISLDPRPRALLDDESRVAIDAASLVATSVHAYAPQHSERLRAILRDMLAEQIKLTI